MVKDLQFKITALDHATSKFDQIGKAAERLSMPAAKASHAFSTLTDPKSLGQMHKGLGALARNPELERISKIFGAVERSVGNTGRALEMFKLGPAGAAIGSAGIAIGAIAKAIDVTTDWAKRGQQASNAASRAGLPPERLQKWEGAGRLAGLGDGAFSGALGSFGMALNAAQYGRNQELKNLLGALDVPIKHLKDGAVDAAATLPDFSAKIQKFSAQTQQDILGMAGLPAGLQPMLGDPGKLSRLLGASKDLNPPITGMAGRMNSLAEAAERSDLAAEGLSNRLKDLFEPVAKGFHRGNEAAYKGMNRALAWTESLFGYGGAPTEDAASPTSPSTLGIAGQSLGIRLHNPGLLRSWSDTPTMGGFAKFADDQAGLGAAAQNLIGKQSKYGLNTLAGIIGDPLHGWAPAADGNDVNSYVSDLSNRTGFGPNERLNLADPGTASQILEGLIQHENGRQPYSRNQIGNAVDQAEQKISISIKVEAPPGHTVKAISSGAGTGTAPQITYTLPSAGMP